MKRREFLLAASAAAGGTAAASGAAAAQQGNTTGNQTGGGNATGGGNQTGGNTTGNRTGGGNQTGGGQSGGNQSSGGGGGGGPTKTVTVGPGGSLTFEPAELSLPTGGRVKFVWGSGGHNVSPANGNWGHKPIEDQGFSYTTPPFQQSGTQEYWCDPHKSAGMTGTITVGGGGGGGGGGEEEVDPTEMGVPLQAHFVGIATVLMMVVSIVYTFFVVKYGESPNAKGGN